MAGAACKVVINNGVKALMESLERILTDKDIHAGRLSEDVRLKLIQMLADIDLVSYGAGAGVSRSSLCGVLTELEKYGLITAEVWEVYARPS